MRDAQRQKLYDSEQKLRRALDRGARGGDAGPTLERKWGSLGEVQTYTDEVTDALGLARVEVRPRSEKHRMSSMDSRHRRMNLIMSWGARELVVLHELAHYVTFDALPSHGPHFSQNFITLVGHHSLGGPGLAGRLRDVLTKGKVAIGRSAANDMALRELRNIRHGIRGAGTARLITESLDGAFTSTYMSTVDLRQPTYVEDQVDSENLVAIGISYR